MDSALVPSASPFSWLSPVLLKPSGWLSSFHLSTNALEPLEFYALAPFSGPFYLHSVPLRTFCCEWVGKRRFGLYILWVWCQEWALVWRLVSFRFLLIPFPLNSYSHTSPLFPLFHSPANPSPLSLRPTGPQRHRTLLTDPRNPQQYRSRCHKRNARLRTCTLHFRFRIRCYAPDSLGIFHLGLRSFGCIGLGGRGFLFAKGGVWDWEEVSHWRGESEMVQNTYI